MHWIQGNGKGGASLSELQLDIVGFLAILGEGSVLANAQVSTLSKWIFLPRLIPAPQALMKPSRPLVLEPAAGRVSGIFSGNYRDNINHIGNIVCDASKLAPYAVQIVEIKRVNDNRIKFKTVAPLTAVIFLGFTLSALLLGLSIWLHDGMSIVATCLLSLLSTVIGYGNKWDLHLPKRGDPSPRVPCGNVAIRYPQGSFLIVRCEEDVARELYFAPVEIEYLLPKGPAYRLLSLIGTVMLMGGVICLANAQIELQIAWAGSYMLLGSAYWIVAALPSKMHWDTSCYQVTHECLSDSNMNEKGYPSENKSFTQGLWKAIVAAKNTSWIEKSGSCPSTQAWAEWLNLARACSTDAGEADQENMKDVKTWQVPDWDPKEAYDQILTLQGDFDNCFLSKGVEQV